MLCPFLNDLGTCHGEDGPYCGIYAMFGAAAALDVRGNIESLIDPQYVSGRTGSTLGDLMDAAEQLGVKAQPLSGLGISSLKESRDPLILHVASFGQLEAFNHWLLFLGMQDGKARTVDSSGKLYLMNVSELLSRWDGVGLAVFTANKPLTRFGSVELSRAAWSAMVVLCCVSGIAAGSRWLGGRWSWRPQGAVVLVGSLLALLGFRQLEADTNLWRNSSCVEFVQAAHGLRSFPELTLTQMQDRLKQPGGFILFDTRYAGDMNWGHLPGALALPIDSTQSQVSERVVNLDRQKPVILYCQSAGCGFSDWMAIVLTSFGFRDVSIYRGGWREWETSLTEAEQASEAAGEIMLQDP